MIDFINILNNLKNKGFYPIIYFRSCCRKGTWTQEVLKDFDKSMLYII